MDGAVVVVVLVVVVLVIVVLLVVVVLVLVVLLVVGIAAHRPASHEPLQHCPSVLQVARFGLQLGAACTSGGSAPAVRRNSSAARTSGDLECPGARIVSSPIGCVGERTRARS
jgi:hypothetical protein